VPETPSIFMSHAHEDKALARGLTTALGERGYRVWLDEVELRIGDSLVERIAGAIAEGDFLLAIVSPDSLESKWCQQELSWAASKGIADTQVVVLPIRHRGAQMPAVLADRLWADADAVSVDELAERIARDVERHRADGGAEATETAAPPATDGRPGWLGDLHRVEESVAAISEVVDAEMRESSDGRLAQLFQPTRLPTVRRQLAGRLAQLERAGGPELPQCRELAEGNSYVFYQQVMAGVFAATDEIAHALESTPVGGEVAEAETQPAAPAVDPGAALRALDAVAERLVDLYAQWDRCRNSGDPTDALIDRQRRLRLAIDAVPGGADALPVVGQLAKAEWNDFFRTHAVADVESDANVEIEAARRALAHGRIPPPRWRITGGYGQVNAGSRDATAYGWEIARGDEARRVTVYISGTAMASTAGLPAEVVEAKATEGRSAVLRYLGEHEPPAEISATTAGITP
jgi:hypothetical protein